ncbi:MAG: hypothetical protein ABI343_08335 [Burkholderiaceae bacterium]
MRWPSVPGLPAHIRAKLIDAFASRVATELAQTLELNKSLKIELD